jgi:hypothetical protein
MTAPTSMSDAKWRSATMRDTVAAVGAVRRAPAPASAASEPKSGR